MTNCSRTLVQNFSSGEAGVGGSLPAFAPARVGVTIGAAPLTARSRANSRRFMCPPLGAALCPHPSALIPLLSHGPSPSALTGEADSTPVVDDPVAQDHGAVHEEAKRDVRQQRAPQRQP